MTVGQWLRQQNTPRAAIAQFWQPLVWGALNTPLENASLRILCNVLFDGVWAGKSGSDYLLPKQDLGMIVAEPALAKLRHFGADIRLETRVCRLKTLPDGRVSVNGEFFDAAVLAVAPYHAAALLPEDTPTCAADRTCRRNSTMAAQPREARTVPKRSIRRYQHFRSRRYIYRTSVGGKNPHRRQAHLPLFKRTRSRPRHYRKTRNNLCNRQFPIA